MDALQLIKNEIRELQTRLRAPLLPKGNQEQNLLNRHVSEFLQFERDYLLPELKAVCLPKDPVIERVDAELAGLLRAVSGGMQWSKQIEEIDTHLRGIEERILPLMRQKISTQEREELYESFCDARQLIAQERLGLAL